METLEPNHFYHIYNRANGSELLFRDNRNYYYFLQKYKQHLTPFIDTLSYCLIPNHFHLLIYVKENDLTSTASKAFSNLFSGYTQAYNKLYHRTGSLFQKNFKRKRICDQDYLLKLINYIHFNPVSHGLVKAPNNWTFSSYNAILKAQDTSVCHKQVIELFDGKENFKYMHQHAMDFSFEY